MSFFAKNQAHRRRGTQRRLAGGPARHLHRQGRHASATSGSSPTRRWCCSAPTTRRGRRRRAVAGGDQARSTRSTRSPRASTPGTSSGRSASRCTVVDDVPDLLPEPVRERVRPPRRADRARLDPRARRLGPGHAGPAPASASRRRWSPSWCWPAGAAPSARSGPGRATGGDGGLLAAFDARLPFELTAGQREVGAQIEDDLAAAAPDEPAAPGRGRLRQDAGRAAGDAAGRRLRRPGGAAGADRGARPAAPPLDHRAARRPRRRRDARRRRRGDDGRAAHRLDDQGPAHRGAARGWRAARPAS